MKVTAFFLLTLNCISFTSARLLEKIPATTSVPIKAQKLHLIRVTRQIYEEESSAGLSKEDNVEGNENISPFDLKPKNANIFITTPTESIKTLIVNKRYSRESRERLDTESKNVTENDPVLTKPKPLLVKKPTPIFKDIDYDENYQSKGGAAVVKSINSSEQADEDFNIDDYDFDVNHDEFSSRGKHVEFRQKQKIIKTEEIKETTAFLEPKLESEVVIKVVVQNRKIKKSVDQMKEDYYDDITTTTARDELDVNGEGSRESDYKDYDRKTTIEIDSLLHPGHKSSALSKRSVLEGRDFRTLPLFPVNTQSDIVVATSPVDDIHYLRVSIF